MSYEKQTASEQLKKRMYDMMLERPYTRKQLIKALGISKNVVVNHLVRFMYSNHVKLHPDRVLEQGPQRANMVSQYISNPRHPFEPKDPRQLAKETVKRFSLGMNKEKPLTPSDTVHVYRLLDNPLPRAPRKDKKRIVSIGSSFNLVGW